MTTENISSPEVPQEGAEILQSSTQKQCHDSSDCPPGCSCVNGECVQDNPEA
jgi:hypothetical protein